MQAQLDAKEVKVVRIGPDRVTITAEKVTIEARHELPDWEVREFDMVPIYFEDKKHFLSDKRKAKPPYALRYVLKPWPEGQHTSARRFHTYDAGVVAERDSNRRAGMRDELMRCFLLPLYPFLGLLWSGMQNRLGRFGFVARSITGTSIFTVFGLLFAQGVFAVVMISTSLRIGKIMLGGMIRALANGDHFQIGPISIPIMLLDSLLIVAFLADVLIRYSNYLRDDEWVGGFLEWIVPRRFRRKTSSAT
jgi:hypothetical protein